MARCSFICRKLNEDRQNSLSCDATILVESKPFPVHKCVMCASSSYFCAMFTGHFTEKTAEQVEIEGVSAETFAVILDYIYGTDIVLTIENVEEIYRVGDMLCIDSLREDCLFYLKEESTVWKNVEDVYQVAVRLDLQDLSASIVEKARQEGSFNDVSKLEMSDSFLCILLDGTNMISQLNDQLPLVLDILRWAFYKYEERLPNLVLNVLSCVHFELITKITFTRILDFVFENPKQICSIVLRRLAKDVETMCRASHQKIIGYKLRLVFTYFSETCKTLFIYEFIPETWEWVKHTCHLHEAPESLLVSDNNLLILTKSGGVKFDLKNRSKAALPNLPENRMGSELSVVDGTVYVMSGFIYGTVLHASDILQLSPSSRSWETCGTWKEKTYYVSSVTYGQGIYLVAGYRFNEGRSWRKQMVVLEYNTRCRNFRNVIILPGLYSQPIVLIHEGKLYIFSRISCYETESLIEAIDLKSQKLVTGDVNSLDLRYPIVSVCSIASGILIACECEDDILVTLYRPTGERPSEVLGLVSRPEGTKYFDLKLLFYNPK